jgi:hypothetical protein
MPRILGGLNIAFGLVLLLCLPCVGAYVMLLTNLSTVMELENRGIQSSVQAAQKRRLDDLDTRARTAKTEAEKGQIRSERASVRSMEAPRVSAPNFDMFGKGFRNPRVIGFYFCDLVSSMLLNLLLIIGGIGLVGLREWGRKLSLWVAGLKVARLVTIYMLNIVLIGPLTTQAAQEGYLESVRGTQAAPAEAKAPSPEEQAADFGRTLRIAGIVMSLGIMGAGSAYPLILLWLLSQPEARTACRTKHFGVRGESLE